MQMVKRFGETALSIEALKTATLVPHVDPLNEFSSRCRDELQSLVRHRA
jgi:hypothetical protein